MYIVAITGGIGAGKTIAADYFASRGAVVIDLDDVARGVLQPGTAVFARVVEAFGDEILDDGGAIDRAKLADVAFASDEATQRLNAIMHPAIASEVMPGLTDMGLLQNPPPLVVLVVPLLVEAPVYAEIADVIVTIEATVEDRIARVVERGMDEADARARVARQSTAAERAALADYVIPNAGTPEDYEARLAQIWDEVVVSGS
jgi:dephospho-CoA kinase